MKRDMDLVRLILLRIEESDDICILDLNVDGYDHTNVAYHCELLYNENFIMNFKTFPADGDPYYSFSVGQLTWEGTDFLDSIRDESIWNKVKTTAQEKGLPLVIETIKEIGKAIISTATSAAVSTIINGGIK